jgi:hypothetical protein
MEGWTEREINGRMDRERERDECKDGQRETEMNGRMDRERERVRDEWKDGQRERVRGRQTHRYE